MYIFSKFIRWENDILLDGTICVQSIGISCYIIMVQIIIVGPI